MLGVQVLQAQLAVGQWLGLVPPSLFLGHFKLRSLATGKFQTKHYPTDRSPKKVKCLQVFWLVAIAVSLVWSVLEFHAVISQGHKGSTSNSGNKGINLLSIILLGFLVELHAGAVPNYLFFQLHFQETETLFKCLINCSTTVDGNRECHSKKNKGDRILNLVIVSIAMSCMNVIVVVPILVATFPCAHTLLIKLFFPVSAVSPFQCSTLPISHPISFLLFRLFLYLVHFVLILPLGLLAGPICTICLLTVSSIHTDLNKIRNFSKWNKTVSSYQRTSPLVQACFHHRLAGLYRQAQIFVLLSNNSLQSFVWTNCQFNGGILIIISLYTVILLGSTIPSSYTAVFILFILAVVAFCFFIFDVGSKPYRISRTILKSWQRQRRRPTGCWWGKFCRSCKPVSLHVGPFHKMDRATGPAFIRFCVQRAVYMVVQTDALMQNSPITIEDL